jgi:hypothetical protein
LAPQQISEIDRAGIDHVKEFENKNGRFPNEMPPTHPGYDIESKDSDGNIVRYIEVKSLSDIWGSRGVSLSDTQFEKAIELGDKYWLYVVEQSLKDYPNIYCIPNPGQMVNQYFYDHGWKQLSKGD